MNAKVFTLALLAMFACGNILSSGAEPLSEAQGEWKTQIYPKIGLKMDLPPWKMDIDDQDRSWSLLAFPLVENPASDVQYQVLVSAIKLPEQQYLRFYRDPRHKLSDWANSEHLQTSQMTNDFWIYTRRDVVGSNGFAYNLTGRVKRLASAHADLAQRTGGSEEKLAAEVRRILNSIEVLSTNLPSGFLPK
jgi:hypothetical protein